MFITNIDKRAKLESIIVAQLKEIGVPHVKEKKPKTFWNDSKFIQKRIFHCHLDLMELADVIIANQEVVQIPKFLADAGEQIVQKADTEGIFRKTGSITRQKAIIGKLDDGIPLGTDNNILDVANIFKTFFRQLTNPLIPNNMQETLIRGLLLGEKKVDAILMACLLMPMRTICILAFLMQLLNKISLNIMQNKMSIENLAIIFAPGIMPLTIDRNGIRFTNHIKVVQILIQNANDIGIVPAEILLKLENTETPNVDSLISTLNRKPRSNSITRMLNGFKKIVTGTKPSNDNQSNYASETVPCIRGGGPIKRKLTEVAFDSEKRKEIIASLPGVNGLLPKKKSPEAPLAKKRRTEEYPIPVKAQKPDKKEIMALSPIPIFSPFNFSDLNVNDEDDNEPQTPTLIFEKYVLKTSTPKVTAQPITNYRKVATQDSETRIATTTSTVTQASKPAEELTPSSQRNLKFNNLQCHYRDYLGGLGNCPPPSKTAKASSNIEQ